MGILSNNASMQAVPEDIGYWSYGGSPQASQPGSAAMIQPPPQPAAPPAQQPQRFAGGGGVTSRAAQKLAMLRRAGDTRRTLDLNDPKLGGGEDKAYKQALEQLKLRLQSSPVLDLNDPSLPSRRKDTAGMPSRRVTPNVQVEDALSARPTDPVGQNQVRGQLHNMVMGEQRQGDRMRALQRMAEMFGDDAQGLSPEDLAQYTRSFDTKGFSRAGPVDGPGTGRSDDINAMLSDGEYVFDAETVSLLGDGSNKAGAQQLDQLRENIRAHKGRALARGEFSPDAKAPEAYLRGGQ